YRNKRSHFDGQDILEAGTAEVTGKANDGWLNRMLQQVPGLTGTTAYSVGLNQNAVLAGDAPVSDWSPDINLKLSPQGERLLELVMHDDPLFQRASAQALEILTSLSQTTDIDMGGEQLMMMDEGGGKKPGNRFITRLSNGPTGRIAEFTANRLRGDARIAAFSLGGWDTHGGQKNNIERALLTLSVAIMRLRQDLGPVWGKTTVIAMTEFGRTVRENGSGGTDHGTGGLSLFAGGAVRGGQVVTDWPGLNESDLFARRDLMPTRDVRAFAGWAMRGLYGFDRTTIENAIFPGLQMGDDPGIIA
ncbi:MAG: DUF1501 domain-containing protein, partial [Planktomarina sp.]